MKKLSVFILLLCAIVFLFAFSANGQGIAKSGGGSALSQIVNGSGKVTVGVVGSAGKIACGITKFAAKNAALPIAKVVVKPILFKLTPTVTLFALKLAGKTVKKSVPLATRAGYAYLRTRLPI